MEVKNVFARHELKYILTPAQYAALLEVMPGNAVGDEYGKYTIQSLYYDTNTSLLIRRSIEGPEYKEKLRIRGYGLVRPDDGVYVELKKKYIGKVYKRRIKMKYSDASDFVGGRIPPPDGQISAEITYFRDYYKTLAPSMILIYDRTAFKGIDDPNLRITFDDNILFRDFDLSLDRGHYGERLLEGKILMEIKAETAMPLWLVRALSKNKIYKTSYSKYGNAYKKTLCRKEEGQVGYSF